MSDDSKHILALSLPLFYHEFTEKCTHYFLLLSRCLLLFFICGLLLLSVLLSTICQWTGLGDSEAICHTGSGGQNAADLNRCFHRQNMNRLANIFMIFCLMFSPHLCQENKNSMFALFLTFPIIFSSICFFFCTNRSCKIAKSYI